jgi:hypothetical protein
VTRSFGNLVRSTAPALSWAPILVGSATLLAIAVWALLTGADHPLTALRLGTIVCVAGSAFAFDDPAANTTAPYPVSLRLRCASRAAIPATLGTATWLAAVALAPLTGHDVRVLATEALALAALAIAAALLALRTGSPRPGLIVGPLLFGFVLLSARLGSYAILPYDVAAQGTARPLETALAHLALIVVLAGLASLLATKDPVRQRRRSVVARGRWV